MPTIRWRPGLRPGPRWGSSRRSPRAPSRLGRGTPPPQEPHSPQRLRRLDPRAFGARCRGTFGALFLAYTNLYFYQYTTDDALKCPPSAKIRLLRPCLLCALSDGDVSMLIVFF